MKTTTAIKILTVTLTAILAGYVIECIQTKGLYMGADFTGALAANIVILSAMIAKKKKEEKNQNTTDKTDMKK